MFCLPWQTAAKLDINIEMANQTAHF